MSRRDIHRVSIRGRRRRRLGLACAALMLAAPALNFADSDQAVLLDEEKSLRVKAAYLLNFAKFTEWPDDFEEEKPPLVLCLLGEARLAPILRGTVQDKAVRDRDVVVRTLDTRNPVPSAELLACHVLYIDDQLAPNLQRVLEAVRRAPVLTVGEGPSFAVSGGMLALVLEEGRIAFHVNVGAVKETPLQVSAKLLALATRVLK